MKSLVNPGAIVAEKQKQLDELTEPVEYLLDLFVPLEKVEEPKGLVARLEEAPEHLKELVKDIGKVAVATALASVKHHAPDFDLMKVAEEVDLEELVESQDVKAATEEVIEKVDL